METKLNEIKTLNKYGIGLPKLSEIYHVSTKTLVKYLNSPNKQDKHNETNRVYKVELLDKCEYFADASLPHLKTVKQHDRDRLTNFPLIYFLANKQGKLIAYHLSRDIHENAHGYLELITNAQLPKGAVIHIDLYSTNLFKILESQGYRVCHVNKRLRVKQHKAKCPYFQQVEHLFSNVHKAIRRIQDLSCFGNLKQLPYEYALELTISLIELYHYNNQHNYLQFIELWNLKREQITQVIGK